MNSVEGASAMGRRLPVRLGKPAIRQANRSIRRASRLFGGSGRADDPGRGGGEDALRSLEIGQRLTQVGGDLRPDLLDAVFPEPEYLARGAERHVEFDRVVEVVADLQRQ